MPHSYRLAAGRRDGRGRAPDRVSTGQTAAAAEELAAAAAMARELHYL